LTVGQVKAHEWFQSMSWEALMNREVPAIYKPDIPNDIVDEFMKKGEQEKREKVDEWEKFTEFSRTAQPTVSTTSVDQMKRISSMLVEYLVHSKETQLAPEFLEEIANSMDSAASLVLQGQLYRGWKGYDEYKQQQINGGKESNTEIIDGEVQEVCVLSHQEIQVLWTYGSRAAGKPDVVHNGASMFVFGPTGLVISGANSYQLPSSAGASLHSSALPRTSGRKTKGSKAANSMIDDSHKWDRAQMMLRKAIEFTQVLEDPSLKSASDIEGRLRNILAPDCVIHNDQSKDFNDLGLDPQLIYAVELAHSKSLLESRMITVNGIGSVNASTIRMRLEITGKTKSDARSMASLQGKEMRGMKIVGGADYNLDVFFDLAFNENDKVSQIWKFQCSALLLAQIHVPARPGPEWLVSAEQLSKEREISINLLCLGLMEECPPYTTFEARFEGLRRVLGPRIAYTAPDAPLMLSDPTCPIVFRGRDMVLNYMRQLREVLNDRLSNFSTSRLKMTWLGDDEVQVDCLQDAIHSGDCSKHLVYALTAALAGGAPIGKLSSIEPFPITLHMVHKIQFLPNSATVANCITSHNTDVVISQTGALANEEAWQQHVKEFKETL